MEISLKFIVSFLKKKQLQFSVEGKDITVCRIAGIGPNVKNSICYYTGYDPLSLEGIQRSIVVCRPELTSRPAGQNAFILTENPQLCFYYISSLFAEKIPSTVSSQSLVDDSIVMGSNVSIGPFCHIDQCKIGNNVQIESGVRISKHNVIGDNVRIESNSVIGATGVMWAWDNEGKKVRCAQTGNVILEDNVFIGANVTVVRGAFENIPTIIGQNCMIAHGSMIGHGTIIGANTHFANNVTIAGSVHIGESCFLGSGSTVRPHIEIPEGTIVGAGAVVVKNFDETGLTLIGNPARVMEQKKKVWSGVPTPFSSSGT